ncbi:sugar transferase [Paenibacillus alkalitolerans]|uniref:sugar transferase n=1 Tax=Paenibacillus alkalitolerans TaxID=2799335 RepID=UPI0018F6243F|nr:sugar transferase [Paenibacillus alkalitolerans]
MSATNEAKALEHSQFRSAAPVQQRSSLRLYLVSKRALDIVASLFGLLLCMPLFIVLAVLIKIEDPKGPVLFSQSRIGKNGKQFNMYKFRSMVSNAEELLEQLLDKNEVSGLMFKMKEDPRVTRVGKLIRKTSMDELPQLFNVLRGEMSLVGPRPPLPREVKEYTARHWKRLEVTPGCTGLWQVSGRNSVGFEEMVELDLKYIQERTFFYDIKIIFKTVWILIRPNDAF